MKVCVRERVSDGESVCKGESEWWCVS